MAKDETRRLKPHMITNDEAAFNALQKIKGYAPSSPECTIEALRASFDEMHAAQMTEDQILAALATARDKAAAQEWKTHNLMLRAKDQVKGQFGKDSLEVQEIGLKRVSDYKRPAHKGKPSPSETPA